MSIDANPLDKAANTSATAFIAGSAISNINVTTLTNKYTATESIFTSTLVTLDNIFDSAIISTSLDTISTITAAN